MTPEFQPFPKMGRLFKDICVTEKLDGTSATIYIDEELNFFTGSRNKWITPASDNYGFSTWAHKNKDELMQLGPGWHRGEWWGQGIQRRYSIGEKRFSLFSVHRWHLPGVAPLQLNPNNPNSELQAPLPACCCLVPVLYQGPFDLLKVKECAEALLANGSVASPSFKDPEGVVVYHAASGICFKYTLHGDGHKGNDNN